MARGFFSLVADFTEDFGDANIENVGNFVSINTDVYADDLSKYFLKNCAYTGCFIVLLLLLSWWYGESSVEERFDPVEAAHEERDAAFRERDDAQRAWAEMGTKHERALETILKLHDEMDKNFKDLPWLNQRNYELAEENIVQYNEIQSFKLTQQKYDELMDDVPAYGGTAKRPEQYQQMCESLQRQLHISDHHLRRSEKDVKDLKETLETQQNMANKEKDWLQAKLKKNARSTAYWAKFRTTRTTEQSKPAWGVRCACTEPEIAYALKDQTHRIAELEANVEARDSTISRLRESRGDIVKNDPSSASNTITTFLSSTDNAGSGPTPAAHTTNTTIAHACEHCKDLEKQVADDAKTITKLRKECQGLRDASSELAAKKREISDLQEKDEKAATNITNLENALSATRKNLADARSTAAEHEQELGRQKTRANELEATQGELEEKIKQKDFEIQELEDANQELAVQPASTAATTSLENLRRQYEECKGQSETRSAKISELQAAGRKLQATTEAKDDKIARLEEQLSNAPTVDSIESQNQSHKEAISKKDQEYQNLYDLYNKALDRQRIAEAKCTEDEEARTKAQQNENAKQLELQGLWTEYTNFRNRHSDCNRRMTNLENQLRQGGNAFTDLQVRYNDQATKLDTAKLDVDELRNQVANLKQANTNLQQAPPTSETEVEQYRLEGENRVRPIWQANVDREMSALARQLETSHGEAFKLQNQLQQAKNQATPLREMQLKSREDAVKAREDALKQDTNTEIDAMDHDQKGGSNAAQQEIKALETKLAAANKEAGDTRLRRNLMERQLNKERKERKDEQERHEREMKREKEDFEKRSNIQKLRLEKENPLKGAVSQLQNEVARLEKELKERK